MAKRSATHNWSKVCLALALVLVVVILSVNKDRFFQNTDQEIFPSTAPNTSHTPIFARELDENGVFIDYINGFALEYPNEILSSIPLQTFETGVSKNFSIAGNQDDKSHWISYGVSSSSSSVEDYEKLNSLSIGESLYDQNEYSKMDKEKWPLWNRTKQRDIKLDNNSGIMLYTYPTGGGTGTPSWGYSTVLKVDNKIVTIGLYTIRGKQELDKYKSTYQNIVDSFKKSN